MTTITLQHPCPKCQSPVLLHQNLISCSKCSFKFAYTCPICRSELYDSVSVDKKEFLTCQKCHSHLSLKKIASILDFGLKTDYDTTCPFCQGPTLHRHDMNIGHRCFFYPSCSGQSSLFQNTSNAYVFLDFETTGLEVMKEELIEVGAYKLDREGVDSFYQSLIKASKPLSETVKGITHITDEMLVSAPSCEDVCRSLVDLIGDAIIVAHNAEFDLLWLLAACERFHLTLNSTEVICTLQWAKEMGEKTLGLEGLARKYNLSHKNAHRALADAASTKELFFIFEGQNTMPAKKIPLSHFQRLYEGIKKKYSQFASVS
ncbi:MAG: 3'-5' exonuclease [bacterium]